MAASPARRAATAERRRQAVTMRLAGVDWETIAERLGYSGRAAAHKDVTRALEANLAAQTTAVELLRQEELLRLDRLQAAAWTSALAGDIAAINTILKIIDRRCKLLGLDAPQRHEVFTLDALDAEIRRLTAELGPAAAGPTPPPTPPAAAGG